MIAHTYHISNAVDDTQYPQPNFIGSAAFMQ
jgi:hypothetical protein